MASLIKVSGPIFDGRATAAIRAWIDDTKKDLAREGDEQLRVLAGKMNRSGRATGHAASTISVMQRGPAYVIKGNSQQGEIWWPWLEGTSTRNEKTRFKGYHAFRKTRLKLRRMAQPKAQELLDKYIAQMGGE